ncbi:MAG TPA: hypothetical protein VFX70_10695 [Mycobacteriales bacterium]|nr:hypothetical protein [Mycobacteriales bacterium]
MGEHEDKTDQDKQGSYDPDKTKPAGGQGGGKHDDKGGKGGGK